MFGRTVQQRLVKQTTVSTQKRFASYLNDVREFPLAGFPPGKPNPTLFQAQLAEKAKMEATPTIKTSYGPLNGIPIAIWFGMMMQYTVDPVYRYTPVNIMGKQVCLADFFPNMAHQ